jgi:hypothetical protein
LALPALQRAQRDTQRKEDISRFMTAVTHYEANNRGAIPDFTKTGSSEANPVEGNLYTGCNVNNDGSPVKPDSFCGRYLIVQGANDQFADPDGTPYVIKAANSFPSANSPGVYSSMMTGTVAPLSYYSSIAGVGGGVTIINNYSNTSGVASNKHGGYSAYGYTIHVIYSATCNGEYAIASSGARKFAVLYKLEGGGVICQSN